VEKHTEIINSLKIMAKHACGKSGKHNKKVEAITGTAAVFKLSCKNTLIFRVLKSPGAIWRLSPQFIL